MKRVLLQPGFILHRTPYRNSSLLLEIFTAEYGRVPLVAKGIRSAKSPKRALLQPFRPLVLSWSGRGELQTLTDVEASGASINLTGNTLYNGFYLNELLMKLLHRDDPHPILFEIYLDSLQTLSANSDEEQTLRFFELKLLSELGYGLQLECDVNTGDLIQEKQQYIYDCEKGPMLYESNDDNTYPVVPGEALLALAKGELHTDSKKPIKQLMRALIEHHLNGKTLNSRSLFQKI